MELKMAALALGPLTKYQDTGLWYNKLKDLLDVFTFHSDLLQYIPIGHSVFFCLCLENQGVRLAGNSYGSHMGRVEVNYYGRWGTICENGWSSYDADVICGYVRYSNLIPDKTLFHAKCMTS